MAGVGALMMQVCEVARSNCEHCFLGCVQRRWLSRGCEPWWQDYVGDLAVVRRDESCPVMMFYYYCSSMAKSSRCLPRWMERLLLKKSNECEGETKCSNEQQVERPRALGDDTKIERQSKLQAKIVR